MTNTAACSSCAKEFQAPFKPTPGRVLECPACLLNSNDMTKSEYVTQLLAFLTAKLGPVKAVRLDPDICVIRKDSTTICLITWELQDPDILTLPQIVIANISGIDKSAESTIAAFMKKAGIEASIPNAPIRKF